MNEKEKRRLNEVFKRQIAKYLEEMEEADDTDLYEEMLVKMLDVLIVFRRSQSTLPAERSAPVQLTPGQLAEMAFCAAVADFAMELEEEGE